MENTELTSYCLQHSTSPSPLAKELEDLTRKTIPGSQMLIGEMEASLLAVLIRAGGVKRVLELGTFTGYSALVMAENLPDDGEIITVDVNPGTVAIAEQFWKRSSHGRKIKSILKPGVEFLPTLHEKFDLIFIDADKVNYPFYTKWAHEHLNSGGMLVIDNALWSGKVVQAEKDAHTQGIVEANAIAASFSDCVTSLLPVRDGMLLMQKKS